ncbi:inorganic phosphate transporter [Crenobacter intestini]|uniref:Phosphate transporter n=1 Tax=Crenobacter intestini TaxID=2563443 RepID=A0A4T0URC7_9NEIS|nr:inorganic phosphate transporter [Crenobacter intestini]TIC81344.1 inorganic phosphate transporter [Crenobacter intestini]
MDPIALFLLSSGLFLGWSLGANDAANVFGTAVGSRMVRFGTAALICSVFVILGATISGAGAAHTLSQLGAISELGGAFAAALAAAAAVMMMTHYGLPVSTGQAIIGAIIGWNLFSGTQIDTSVLSKILMTWVLCPILSAIVAVALYRGTDWTLRRVKPHVLTLDAGARWALIVAGAFGSYSLGANNIANVMGVFMNSVQLPLLSLGLYTLSPVQTLFLVGGVAIAVGVYTYSKRVMLTVGQGLMPLSPVAAWVVVMSHSVVLFLFASQDLQTFLASHNLPTIPLVPVSSSQAIVGAVIGIGLLKGGQSINWRMAGRITGGWVLTPFISAAICLACLLVVQNVMRLPVHEAQRYELSEEVLHEARRQGVEVGALQAGRTFERADKLGRYLAQQGLPDEDGLNTLVSLSYATPMVVSHPEKTLPMLSALQLQDIRALHGAAFNHLWQLRQALEARSEHWRLREATPLNAEHNKYLETLFSKLYVEFKVKNRNGENL